MDYSLPRSVKLAVLAFVAAQLLVIGYRDILDSDAYLLNTSKLFSVNTNEDDGNITLYSALGYRERLTSYRHFFIDTGGPFLHAAHAFLLATQALGLNKVYPDPAQYQQHPQELVRAWRMLALFKLCLVAFLPVIIYWIGRNFLTPQVGVLAAWLVALTPFFSGFEIRLKPDSVAITLGFLSFFYQLAYLQSQKKLHFFLATFVLALSLAVKLIMPPLALTLLGVYLVVQHRQGHRPWHRASLLGLGLPGVLLFAGAFILSNPLYIPGFMIYIDHTSQLMGRIAPPSTGAVISALVWRLEHFDSFFGLAPALLFMACLAIMTAFYGWRLKPASPAGLVVLLFYLHAGYMSLLFKQTLVEITYYYLVLAIFLIIIAALALGGQLPGLFKNRPFARLGFMTPALLALALMAHTQMQVLHYVTNPSNRQQTQAWIKANLAPGATIGQPQEESSPTLQAYFRLDPFRHNVHNLGESLELAEKYKPDYIVWRRASPDTPLPNLAGYALAARFDQGQDLPHERYDLYQEETYEVYRREVPSPQARPESRPVELALAQALMADPEPQFNVLSLNALPLYPISLSLFRKTGDSLQPLPLSLLSSSVRDKSSGWAYIHQLSQQNLSFWGIKYLVIRQEDLDKELGQAFTAKFYHFTEFTRFTAQGDGQTQTYVVYLNPDYQGQARLVTPVDGAKASVQTGHWRYIFPRYLKPYGQVYARADLPGANTALQVHLEVKTPAPADFILKGGLERRSFLLGPGQHQLDVTYEPGQGQEDIGYELNPVNGGDQAAIKVWQISARPVKILGQPRVRVDWLSNGQAFVGLEAPSPGLLCLALPLEQGQGSWRASLNSQDIPVSQGPMGTLGLEVPAGKSFVSFNYDQSW